MPLPRYEKIRVLTTLTHSPTTRTNSNKRKTTFSNHKQKKSKSNYWPTLHATMEMTEYLLDKSWFYVELSPKIQKQSR